MSAALQLGTGTKKGHQLRWPQSIDRSSHRDTFILLSRIRS